MADKATWLGILVVALAVYAMRLAGYFLGSRIRRDSVASRVLDALPGAALAGVLALSLQQQASLPNFAAVAATTFVYVRTGQTLPALGLGLLIAVASAHLSGW